MGFPRQTVLEACGGHIRRYCAPGQRRGCRAGDSSATEPPARGSSSTKQSSAAWSAVQRSCANSCNTSPRWQPCPTSASLCSPSAPERTPSGRSRAGDTLAEPTNPAQDSQIASASGGSHPTSSAAYILTLTEMTNHTHHPRLGHAGHSWASRR